MSVDVQKRSLFRGRTVLKSRIRMPWLRSPQDFTDLCSRCGHCVPACPSGIIQIGDGGFPEVDFHKGECVFCTECAKACDEKLFDLKRSSPWDISAEVSDQCLNNQSVYCRSCEDSCDAQAIQFNFTNTLFVAPTINLSDCTGCGACVSVCPAKAIAVTSHNQAKPEGQNEP